MTKYTHSNSHVDSIQPYQLVEYEKYPNGIYCTFGSNGKALKHRFIRVATVSATDPFTIRKMTTKQMERDQNNIYKMTQMEFHRGLISKNKYLSIIKKYRDQGIPVVRPVVDRPEDWINHRFQEMNSEQLVDNLKKLVNKNIIVRVYPCANNVDQYLVVLIEYGFVVPIHFEKRYVIGRPSYLRIYPWLKDFMDLFTLTENMEISETFSHLKSHPQSVRIDIDNLKTMYSPYLEKNPNIDYSFIKKFARINYRVGSLPENYIFSIYHDFNIEAHIEGLLDHYTLSPGQNLLVLAEEARFDQWLVQYSYANLHPLITPLVYFKPYELFTQSVIVFSSDRITGFTPIDIDRLYLNIFRRTKNMGTKALAALIKYFDVIYGDQYFSSESGMMELIEELNEYDNEILSKCNSINDLINLLVKQKQGGPLFGRDLLVDKIYFLLRRFTKPEIFDTPIKSDNKIPLPKYSLIDTSQVSPEDAVLVFLLFSLQLKVGSVNDKSMNLSKDFTIVLRDRRLLKLLDDSDIFAAFEQLLLNQGPRVIIHAIDRSLVPDMPRIPKLYLDKKVEDKDHQIRKYSEVELGNSNAKRVEVEKMTNKERRIIGQLDNHFEPVTKKKDIDDRINRVIPFFNLLALIDANFMIILGLFAAGFIGIQILDIISKKYAKWKKNEHMSFKVPNSSPDLTNRLRNGEIEYIEFRQEGVYTEFRRKE